MLFRKTFSDFKLLSFKSYREVSLYAVIHGLEPIRLDKSFAPEINMAYLPL